MSITITRAQLLALVIDMGECDHITLTSEQYDGLVTASIAHPGPLRGHEGPIDWVTLSRDGSRDRAGATNPPANAGPPTPSELAAALNALTPYLSPLPPLHQNDDACHA